MSGNEDPEELDNEQEDLYQFGRAYIIGVSPQAGNPGFVQLIVQGEDEDSTRVVFMSRDKAEELKEQISMAIDVAKGLTGGT